MMTSDKIMHSASTKHGLSLDLVEADTLRLVERLAAAGHLRIEESRVWLPAEDLGFLGKREAGFVTFRHAFAA